MWAPQNLLSKCCWRLESYDLNEIESSWDDPILFWFEDTGYGSPQKLVPQKPIISYVSSDKYAWSTRYPSLARFSLDFTRTIRDDNKITLTASDGIVKCAPQLLTGYEDPKRFQIHFGKLTYSNGKCTSWNCIFRCGSYWILIFHCYVSLPEGRWCFRRRVNFTRRWGDDATISIACSLPKKNSKQNKLHMFWGYIIWTLLESHLISDGKNIYSIWN